MTEVSEKLTASMSLHNRARPSGRTMTRPADWREMLTQAYDLRKQALALDAERTDQAWADEASRTPTGRNTHDAMMRFYASLGLD